MLVPPDGALSCLSHQRGLSESVKKENSWRKSFLRIIRNEVLKICEKWYLLFEKLIKAARDKRSGGSILQIRRIFKTSNASPDNVKNSKKYPLLTLRTYFDTSFTVQFYQVFRDFLVWYLSCACAVFSGSTLKIVNFLFPIQWEFFKYRDTACFSKHNFVTLK